MASYNKLLTDAFVNLLTSSFAQFSGSVAGTIGDGSDMVIYRGIGENDFDEDGQLVPKKVPCIIINVDSRKETDSGLQVWDTQLSFYVCEMVADATDNTADDNFNTLCGLILDSDLNLDEYATEGNIHIYDISHVGDEEIISQHAWIRQLTVSVVGFRYK